MQIEENKQNIQGINEVNDEIKNAVEQKYQILESGYVNLSIGHRGNAVRLSLQSPNSKKRINHDIVAVLDTSFSMCQDAQVKNKNGQKEGYGLSYLDILKHAVNTVINALDEDDRFALVSYNDTAEINYNLNNMTKDNKQKATKALQALDPDGQTNMWAGIEKAMTLLLENKQNNMHQSIILLTDGEPNVFPPKGWIPTLNDYKKKHKNVIPAINCFAFGKSIDSQLLDSLAINGNGIYSFIPCPGFIGTIFVNSISNILCTIGNEVEIELEPLNGTKITHIYNQLKDGKKPEEKWVIHVGDIKFGQTKDIIFEAEQQDQSLPMFNLKLKYYDYQNQQYRISEIEKWTKPMQEDSLVDKDYCRLYFAEHIRHAYGQMKKNQQDEAKQNIQEIRKKLISVLDQLRSEIDQFQEQNKEFELGRAQVSAKHIENLLKDVEGEVTLAFAQVYSFNHWGQHYIPSLSQAHLKQQCNNFIDPGIQDYGGALFQQIRDEAEQIFLKLPAQRRKQVPQQEVDNNQNDNDNQQQSQQQQKQRPRSPPPVDMSVYYNASGGCFEGNCLVRMASGGNKKISDLTKGDIVMDQNESQSVVRALIRIKCPNNETQLVRLPGGLLITPKHPVLNDGVWKKPLELATPETFQCEQVFNVVLDKGHVLLVNGIACVTLGHEFKGDKVQHDYFGSQKIINDLQKITGYEKGQVELPMNSFLRDNITQKVCGINQV